MYQVIIYIIQCVGNLQSDNIFDLEEKYHKNDVTCINILNIELENTILIVGM